MRASAAVLYELNRPLVVEDVEVLEPGPHEVLVRFAANGVCHSDLHVITGDYPHPLPVILGHEAAGVVERVGSGVTSVQVGDHVCSSYVPSCGRCADCMLIDLYMAGKYKLDELISRRLPLSEVNAAFDLLRRGEVKRSVIVY